MLVRKKELEAFKPIIRTDSDLDGLRDGAQVVPIKRGVVG